MTRNLAQVQEEIFSSAVKNLDFPERPPPRSVNQMYNHLERDLQVLLILSSGELWLIKRALCWSCR